MAERGHVWLVVNGITDAELIHVSRPLTDASRVIRSRLCSRWSPTSARTAPWTRTNRSGRSPRSAFSSSLRTSTSPAGSWRYGAAPRSTTFTGRARRSAPRRTGPGWYTTSPPRPSSASTICNRRRTSRPGRRNLTAMLGWKVTSCSSLRGYFCFIAARLIRGSLDRARLAPGRGNRCAGLRCSRLARGPSAGACLEPCKLLSSG